MYLHTIASRLPVTRKFEIQVQTFAIEYRAVCVDFVLMATDRQYITMPRLHASCACKSAIEGVYKYCDELTCDCHPDN